MSVSYTHLDVYKRQVVIAYAYFFLKFILDFGKQLPCRRIPVYEINPGIDLADLEMCIRDSSYSEYQAVEKIFEELDGDRGLLVASKIADQLEITRSVIVNAIRKLESAGVIESNSLGMKGTHIRVLNPYLRECLDKKA